MNNKRNGQYTDKIPLDFNNFSRLSTWQWDLANEDGAKVKSIDLKQAFKLKESRRNAMNWNQSVWL